MDILNTSTENERQIIQRTKPWGSSKGIQVTSSSMPANPAFRMEGSKLPVNLPKLVQQTPRLVVKKLWLVVFQRVATKKELGSEQQVTLWNTSDLSHNDLNFSWSGKNMEIYGNIYSSGKDTWPCGPAFDMAPVCTSQESNKSISYLCSDYLYHVFALDRLLYKWSLMSQPPNRSTFVKSQQNVMHIISLFYLFGSFLVHLIGNLFVSSSPAWHLLRTAPALPWTRHPAPGPWRLANWKSASPPTCRVFGCGSTVELWKW